MSDYQDINTFLQDHLQRLKQVHDRSTLATWHQEYAVDWCANARGLAASANTIFELSGEQVVQPDLAYLAVEAENSSTRSKKAIILLSMNPSYDPVTAPNFLKMMGQNIEQNTVDAAKYNEFRQAFFPRYMDDVVRPVKPRGGSWWNKALGFIHLVASSVKPTGMGCVDPNVDVIGWEISPLRSNKDGITKAMQSHQVLKDFAKESINAALRMDAQCVVAASQAAYDLLEELHVAMGLTLLSKGGIDGIKVASYVHQNGHKIFTIGRQLFAGWGTPSNDTRAVIVDWILDKAAVTEYVPKETPSRKKKHPSSTKTPKIIAHRTPIKKWKLEEIDETKSHALVWLRPITQNADLQLADFSQEDEDVHQRIGGYWRLGSKRMAIITNALNNGQKVYIAGVSKGRVLRVLEITTDDPELPIQQQEIRGPCNYVQGVKQPDGCKVNGKAWATFFTESTGTINSKNRARIHTISCEDNQWIGLNVPFTINSNPKIYQIVE